MCRCNVLAALILLLPTLAQARYTLEGMDDVASLVGNRDRTITKEELPELLFRQKLSDVGAQDFPICDPHGPMAEPYDFDGSGALDLGEFTCFLTNNSLRLQDDLRKRGNTVDKRVKAVRFDADYVKKARRLAKKSLVPAGESVPVSFQRAMTLKDYVNRSYHPDDELDLSAFKRWTISRKLIDTLAVDKDERRIVRPFVFSFKTDSAKDTDTFIANGDIAYRWPSIDRLEKKGWLFQSKTILSMDVDTAEEFYENSIALANKFAWFVDPGHGKEGDSIIDEWVFELTPKFTTDRRFDTEIVSAEFAVGWFSAANWLGRPGYFTPAEPRYGLGDFRFLWTPKIGLEVGDILDDGGNPDLAEQEQDGTYYRLKPRVDWTFDPMGLGYRWRLTGSYAHLLDLDEDFDHGRFEAGVQYKLAKHLSLSVSYATGRNLTTFARENAWLIGIGLQK